jgi:hypothetical protein
MAADKNFTLKTTLADANQIRRSLERDMAQLQAQYALAKDQDEQVKLGAEAMDIERILRISF